jgi:hypothetical protein
MRCASIPMGPPIEGCAPERAERGDTMPMDNWYDLAIRELSDLTDPAKEMLAEALQALPEPPSEGEEEETPEPPPAVRLG